MGQGRKFITEMGPLLLFFLCYKFYGLISATGILIAATGVSVGYVYVKEKTIPLMPLLSAIILGIFGGLTLLKGDEFFIKIKPTLINLLFSIILLVGVTRKKGLLKYLFSGAIEMPDKAWLTFSFRWAIFFLFLAGLNEYIWRNFSTDFWVQFKVFGMLPLSMVFMLTQIPFIHKHLLEEKE